MVDISKLNNNNDNNVFFSQFLTDFHIQYLGLKLIELYMYMYVRYV